MTTPAANKEKEAYLARVQAEGIFDNSVESALPQTIIAKLIRAHLTAESDRKKKVLLYGFDGARADSLCFLIPSKDGKVTGHNCKSRFSAITQLKEKGGLYLSYAGGDPSQPETLQETSTAQGWAAILTGKWGVENGVVHHVPLREDCPTVLTEAARNGYSALFASLWQDHFTITYRDEIRRAKEENLPLTFTKVAEEDELQSILLRALDEDIDLLFGINEFPDGNGHGSGFEPDNYRYVVGVTNADRCAYEILQAIQNRPTYQNEDWLILITSDHGGHGYGHGSQQIEDRLTFLACNRQINQ